MKFTEKTISILKNFSQINESIYFTKGNVIRTCDKGKAVYARAEIEENFEKNFAIYEIPRFLSIMSLLNNPEITLRDTNLIMSSGKQSIQYNYADPSFITYPPSKDINFPESIADFDITAEQLNSIIKACSILQVENIIFTGSNGVITVQSRNAKGNENDSFNIEIGETELEFTAIFKTERIKLIPNKYTVSLTNSGISRFKSDDVTYWIAPESK